LTNILKNPTFVFRAHGGTVPFATAVIRSWSTQLSFLCTLCTKRLQWTWNV